MLEIESENFMTSINEKLQDEIRSAFAARSRPIGRFVDLRYDLNLHLEAQRVEKYFQAQGDQPLDRRNEVIVGLNYMVPEAGIWVLPKYMISLITDFAPDDFLIDIVAWRLASGLPGSPHLEMSTIGVEMRALATALEAAVVCRFCRWLNEVSEEPGSPGTIEMAISLWS